MAGHSKWSQIKRQKAVNDKARGRRFSKLGREISVASRQGGGDPGFNPRLRTAIINAKAENMPAGNIERAVQRGTGELPGLTLEEVIYEGYGPGGAALYIECVTDNPKRTVAELRHLLSKAGGNLGQAGSVAWMFERKGEILLPGGDLDEETALELALAAGAEDVRAEDDSFRLTTSPTEFHAVQDVLKAQDAAVEEAELVMIPKSSVRVEGKEAVRLLRLISDIDDHEDVIKLSSNFDVDDEAWTALELA